jgi:hypothetical protein
MWKTINSPIVITIIVIAALFALKATMKPRLASEIRGVYEELNAIVKDGATDAKKSKAIQLFAQEISAQLREGFSSGFKSTDPKKEDRDKVYLAAKQKIAISSVKIVNGDWPGREKVLFVVTNGSTKCISSLRVNCEFYRNGDLVDCKNEWMSSIKFLEPGQEIALSQDRTLPKDQPDNFKANEVKVKITSFDVKDLE